MSELVRVVVMKCAICKKGITESLENIWEHECFLKFNPNIYHLILNSEDFIEPVIKEEYLATVEEDEDGTQQIFMSIDDIPESSKNYCKRKLKDSFDSGKENTTEINQKKRGKGRPHKTLAAKELSEEEVTENLIEEIAKRDCLWNIRTDAETRGDKQRQEAWESIVRSMGDKWTSEELKERWRYLRRSFIKTYREQNEYIPSGASHKPKPPITFPYYDAMMFIKDSVDLNQESQECSLKASDATPLKEIQPLNTAAKYKMKQINKSSGKQKIEEMFLKCLEETKEKTAEDETQSFLNYLGVQLRKLPQKIRDRYHRQFNRIIEDTLEKLENPFDLTEEFSQKGFHISYEEF